jgi:hypothetical protein
MAGQTKGAASLDDGGGRTVRVVELPGETRALPRLSVLLPGCGNR